MPDWIDALARQIGSGIADFRVAIRALTSFDTNPVPIEWQHITKIDPEDEKKIPVLYPLYLQHTDAVSVGGSADVTARNTLETFELLAMIRDLPTFHEPSAPEHVNDEIRSYSDFLAVPEVLNGHSDSLVGTLGKAVASLREDVVPAELAERLPTWVMARYGEQLADFGASWILSRAIFEAYIIQNSESAAAREAHVTANDILSPEEAKYRALAAEKHLSSEIVYVEYSGTFGDDEGLETVGAISDALTWSRLWYGGGLDSRENARAVLKAGADAIIVGNVFHEIAADERAYFEAARNELDEDADFDDIVAWLERQETVGDSFAARYLSTIPGVSGPTETATRYLAKSIHVLFSMNAMRRSLSDSESPLESERELRRAIEQADSSLRYHAYLRPVTGADSTSLAREFELAWLGDRLEIDVNSELAVTHIAGFHESPSPVSNEPSP